MGKWTEHKLGELAEFQNGNSFKTSEWAQIGLPIIRIQNLNGSKNFNYYKGQPNPKWHVHSGDLLYAWAGVKGVSFGPCLWSGPEGVLNQHIFLVQPKNGISKQWLFYQLVLTTKQIEEKAHGFKTSLLHVHKSELKRKKVA